MIKYLLLLLVPLTVYAATTSIKDNTLKLGAKDSQDIYIYADNGSANLPFIFFDFSEGTWKQSNDGITSEVIGGASVITTEGDLIIGNASGGEVRLPIGTNGKVLTSNGSSATWELPASGGINYITNFNIENDSSGYYTFDDASAYVDGTGGTSANLTISRNTTTPLRETGDLKLVQGAADSRYEGVSYDFTIDRGQQGQMITCSFWADTSDPNYVDDDIIIIAYDKDNSQIIRVNGEDLKANANPQRHYFQFQAASDADDYRVSWMVNQSNTNGYTIYFDQIACSPTRLARGAIVTEWQSFTPTGTWVSGNETYSGYWRRVGDSAEVYTIINLTGAPTSADLILNLPSGLSVDTSKIPSGNNVGSGSFLDSGAALRGGIAAKLTGSGTVELAAENAGVTATNPITWAANDYISVIYTVPIQGWASTGTVSSEDLGGGDVVAYYKGSATTALSASPTIIKYTTKVSDTTNSYDSSTGLFTVPETGYYDVTVSNGTGQVATATDQYMYSQIQVDGVGVAFDQRQVSIGIGYTQAIVTLNGIYLTKGQTVGGYAGSNIGASRNTGTITSVQYITIAKRASGSQKFETATVAARYTSNSGQSWVNAGYLDYEDIDYDTHGAYDTSTGEYTVPISGKYIVSASGMCDSEAWLDGYVLGLNIVVNGSATTQSLHYTAAMTSNLYTSVRDTLDLAKGDVIEVQASTNISTNMNTQSKRNVFSIIRIK